MLFGSAVVASLWRKRGRSCKILIILIQINATVTSELRHGGVTGYVCSSAEDYDAGIIGTELE
jgi:hypothetical protein